MKSYRIYLDGNQWCAVIDNEFVDLQVSEAGFGETPMIALGELINLEITRCARAALAEARGEA